jgi:hypothetical protein
MSQEQFIPDFNPAPPMPGAQQPAMIQTPFGPIANPRAGQPVAPNAPLNIPGQQQNPLFPGTNPFPQQQQPQQMQMPQPGQVFPPVNTPFGAPSSFGIPGAPVQQPPVNNNPFNPSPLFSNPAPTNGPGTPPR